MFKFVLDMVLVVALGTIKNISHITAVEWTAIEEVNNALTALLAKKPVPLAQAGSSISTKM